MDAKKIQKDNIPGTTDIFILIRIKYSLLHDSDNIEATQKCRHYIFVCRQNVTKYDMLIEVYNG